MYPSVSFLLPGFRQDYTRIVRIQQSCLFLDVNWFLAGTHWIAFLVRSWDSGAIGEHTAAGIPRPTYTLVLYSLAVCSPIVVRFWDCGRIVLGFRIALGFCITLQSYSSSFYPSAICSAAISGMFCNFRITLGFCITLQSHSSSYHPSAISCTRILHGSIYDGDRI